MSTGREYFHQDLARTDAELERLGAVRSEGDGFAWVDESKVPADLLRAYQGLVAYGYANGLIEREPVTLPVGHVVALRLTAECANSERFGFEYISGGRYKWASGQRRQAVTVRACDERGWWVSARGGWPHSVLLLHEDVEALELDCGPEDDSDLEARREVDDTAPAGARNLAASKPAVDTVTTTGGFL